MDLDAAQVLDVARRQDEAAVDLVVRLEQPVVLELGAGAVRVQPHLRPVLLVAVDQVAVLEDGRIEVDEQEVGLDVGGDDLVARQDERAHERIGLAEVVLDGDAQGSGRTHTRVFGLLARELRRYLAVMSGDPETEELRVEQVQKELRARDRADEADDPGEERTEERRAERAAYLKQKLEERAKSEEEVRREENDS